MGLLGSLTLSLVFAVACAAPATPTATPGPKPTALPAPTPVTHKMDNNVRCYTIGTSAIDCVELR